MHLAPLNQEPDVHLFHPPYRLLRLPLRTEINFMEGPTLAPSVGFGSECFQRCWLLLQDLLLQSLSVNRNRLIRQPLSRQIAHLMLSSEIVLLAGHPFTARPHRKRDMGLSHQLDVVYQVLLRLVQVHWAHLLLN